MTRKPDGYPLTNHVASIKRDVTRAGGVVPTEQAEAKAFWQWWRAVRVQHPHVVIFCIDHGQRLSFGQIGKAQVRGYEGGVSDYGIVTRGRAGFIELKRRKGGREAEAQKAFRDAVIRAGGFYFLAKGAQAAIDFVTTNVLTEQPR